MTSDSDTHPQGGDAQQAPFMGSAGRQASPESCSDTPDGELARAQTEFETALAAMPFGADRIAKGQQFNAYESAANDEDDDPEDWEFYLSLGPITDCTHVLDVEGEWRAKLIEAALRVAMRSRGRHLTPSGMAEHHPHCGVRDDYRCDCKALRAAGISEATPSEQVREAAAELDWMQLKAETTGASEKLTILPEPQAGAALSASPTSGDDTVGVPQAVREALEDYNSCLRSACSVAERHGEDTAWGFHYWRLKAILEKHHSTWLEHSTFRDNLAASPDANSKSDASPTVGVGDE